MKYLSILLISGLIVGCKPKVLSGVALQNKLIETMDQYLHQTLKPGAHFKIKDVIYYPEENKMRYICQFHVRMQIGNADTSGIMAATITNDFKKVDRTQ